MNMKFLLVFSLVSIAITACGGSSGTADPIDADISDLKNNAVIAIGGRFDSNLSAVGTTLSLATDENSTGTTIRDGNTITVDPDEAVLCREQSVYDGELADCIAFFKDVTVKLVAASELAGELTYLYQQQPVLILSYAPNSESIELNFFGLKTVLSGYELINPSPAEEPRTIPTVMRGSFKVSTTATNMVEGQEAGSITYSVAKQIRIETVDDDGSSTFSMNPGTLLSVNADASTGQGGMTFNLGAISAATPTDSGLGRLNLQGFTGKADVNPANGELVVSNFGLSKGPFSVSINNEEVMSAALKAFGFRVTESTDMEPGEIIIDSDMNLSAMVRQFAGNDLEDGLLAMTLGIVAPSTTSISRSGNGATKIGGAGPLTVSLGSTPEVGDPSEETVEVNSGECFTDLFDEESDVPSAEQCL